MASSLETLVKILKLEQSKGYKNDAVIGGFARFARHWAREANSQARNDEQQALVERIADGLRRYDDVATPEARADAIDELLELASGQIEKDEANPVSKPPPAPQKGAPPPKKGRQSRSAKQDRKPQVPKSARERRGYAKIKLPDSFATPDDLKAEITSLSGVGPKRSEQFDNLGVYTVGDLLRLYPRRYDDYSNLKTIDRLLPGEEITVMGMVGPTGMRKTSKGRPIFEATINDGTGALRLAWFNQPWLDKQIQEGRRIVVSGKIDQYLGYLTMNSPAWEALERESLNTGRIVPVYPLTQGLTGRTMRQIVKTAVDEWTPRLPDPLPLEIRERLDLMDYGDAVSQIHFPDSQADLEAARTRLAFDELFFLQLGAYQNRLEWQAEATTPVTVGDDWVEDFLSRLPYQLTAAQTRALDEIRRDMAGERPMNRLLQGDVGSGKTVVAAAAMGMTLANGRQAALMAPTSILAEQHHAALGGLLGDTQVALLTGNLTDSERQAIYAGLTDGSIQAVVGTHALIQTGVNFADLGLAVIDEQHRFGVRQRGTLRGKASEGNPHLLVMTATPIPRTLALTIHADLDLTILDEMPPGRQPVDTRVLQPKERERAYTFVRAQIEQGRQAYVIYPLVQESETVEAKSAVVEHERLQSSIFPDFAVGLLHGQMTPTEKDAAMAQFYGGETQILVATTVVEVGIDVPNASIIVIEDANRFGLAQLHQLRGRVGRGEHASYCLLLPGGDWLTSNGTDRRLEALEETNDGFKLAEIDWEMRGAGDLLGTRQSGFVGQIRLADLMDPRLVGKVQSEVQKVVNDDPALEAPENTNLRDKLAEIAAAMVSAPGDVS